MTDKSPNVFYETGYAHALEKPTILLAQSVTDIPFDLGHFKHIVYNKNNLIALQQELKEMLMSIRREIMVAQGSSDSQPNKALQPTPSSVRYAPASRRG
jgi:hypothetical protein